MPASAATIHTQPCRLPDAMPLLIKNDAELAADFHAFYPELIAFAMEQRKR